MIKGEKEAQELNGKNVLILFYFPKFGDRQEYTTRRLIYAGRFI